jgi:hypothetical protein
MWDNERNKLRPQCFLPGVLTKELSLCPYGQMRISWIALFAKYLAWVYCLKNQGDSQREQAVLGDTVKEEGLNHAKTYFSY